MEQNSPLEAVAAIHNFWEHFGVREVTNAKWISIDGNNKFVGCQVAR